MKNMISEEHKNRLRKKFEEAAEKGSWILNGGKIIISIERVKDSLGTGKKIKTMVIFEENERI